MPVLSSLRQLFVPLARTLGDILPLAVLLAGTQLLVGGGLDHPGPLGAGLALTLGGLFLFTRGLQLALFPLGEGLADGFARRGNLPLLLAFAFCMGFGATVAEPTLLATAAKAELASGGRLTALPFRLIVAVAVGSALVLGVLRLILGHPLHWYLMGGYLATMGLSLVCPPEVVGIAFDAGGITTSSVTVPLIAALGGGLASQLRGRDPLLDGFGLVAFASLLPIFFVSLYGLAAFHQTGGEVVAALPVAIAAHGLVGKLVLGLADTVRDLAPIAVIIVFFQVVVLRKPFGGGRNLHWGVVWTVVGLWAFMEGLELAIFPLGERLAQDLVARGGTSGLILFAFLLGFATTVAEPALIAIALKAHELSAGLVHPLVLRVTVALGVGIGLAVGVARIVLGGSLVLLLVAGYALVVLVTPLAPRQLLPLAYDSGGVTTSTVTVPLVVALGLALAAAIPGRNPLVDGFGLIAFASLFPILTVMGYGIFGRVVAGRKG